MGLRKDFLVHKRKTIESFRFVKSDISIIKSSVENIKGILAGLDSKISALENDLSSLKGMLERCLHEVGMQRSHGNNMASRIDNANKSLGNLSRSISSFTNKLRKISSKGNSLSKKLVSQNNYIKKLLPRSAKQSLKIRHMNSVLRISQDDIKKLRIFINRKLRTVKRRDTELEETIKKQRRRILQLSRKIEGKKVTRKTSPKRTIKGKIIPKKKITTIKTPKRTITKTETPKRETIVEIIKQKNN